MMSPICRQHAARVPLMCQSRPAGNLLGRFACGLPDLPDSRCVTDRDSAEVGEVWSKLGLSGSNIGRIFRPRLAKFGRIVDQARPNFAEIRPLSLKYTLGSIGPHFGQTRPNSATAALNSAQAGQSGHLWASCGHVHLCRRGTIIVAEGLYRYAQ